AKSHYREQVVALSDARCVRDRAYRSLAQAVAMRQTKRAPAWPGPSSKHSTNQRPAVPSWVEMFENGVFSWPPSVFTTAVMATELPAAIKPYSMAVAPDSSLANCIRVFMRNSWIHVAV